MARDRKRSQGRRKRTPGGGGGNPASSRARDMGLDDASIDESGLTDATAAPDPLKNSSAEVDQAKAAEAGAIRGGSGDVEMGEDAFDDEPYDEDFEHAPDLAENDRALERAPRSLSGSVDPAIEQELHRPRRQRGKVLTFLGHSVDELRRVQWPDRQQVGQATAVVLGFVVIAGSYLGLLDAIWKPLINAII